MKKYIIFLTLISILVISASTTKTTNYETEQKNQNTQTTTSNNSVAGYKGELIVGGKTPYIRYSKEDFDKAKSENKVIYLYFYATWCPICATERPSIFKAFNEMNYDNVIGFEVHFNDDKTTKEDEDLAKELGVAYQHTTIIFDKTGKESYRSLSRISKDKIKEEIAK